MKQKLLSLMLLLCALIVGSESAWADDPVTLVSGSGTSGYAVPDGWSTSGTVEGGSYLKIDNGTMTSSSFAPHNSLSFTYSVATFGSGTNHPLTIRILNASTDAVIVEKTTATPTSSSYINTDSPSDLGDIDVDFKIQLYAPTGKGIRLRNYSVTGIPASGDDPSISADPTTLNPFTYVEGSGPSAAQAISVSGSNLTDPITLNLGNNSNYEVSTTQNNGYSSSLSLSPTNNAVSATNVYVRLKAELAKGTRNGTLTISTDGADDINVSLSGSVTGQTYTVTVATGLTGGTIGADPTSAAESATISLTANPEDAYTFGSWSVYKTGDQSTTVTVENNQFTMPDYAVTVSATFTAKPTHTATFSVNGSTSSNTFYEGQTITFPSDPANISGKKFVGWYTSTYSHASTAPSPLVTSATMGNSDITYYAVFADVTGTTEASWTETAIGSISSSDIIVISNGTYAMNNDGGTSSQPTVNSISVSGTSLSAAPANNLKWNVSGNATDGYTFYPNGSTTTWLYCSTTANTSSNNNIRVGTGDRKVWKFDNSGYLVTKDTYIDRYLSIYVDNNSVAQDFRGYTGTGSAFVPKFYKYFAATTTYANYSTSVEVIYTVTYDANGATSGTVPTDDTEYSEEAEVTVLGNTGNLEKTDYIFSGWNTQDDGEGTDYDEDDTFDITDDVTLYAKWTEKTNSDLAVTSSSPVALSITSANISPTSTITWTTSSGGTMSFVSDDTSVATVTSEGVITAVSEGTAKITISQTASASYKASGNLEVTVNVTDNRTACATGIDLPAAQKTLTKGDLKDFAATSTIADGFTGTIAYTYETSNSDVVAVATGTYSAEEFGTADITITATPTGGNAANYKPASQVVTVTVNGTNSITLDPTSKTVTYSTSTFDIAATVPTDNYSGTISAVSDNTFVATVSVEGTTVTVTPHAVGSAKITVTAGTDTYYPETASAECNVTFTAPAGSATAPSNVVTVFEETFAGCESTGGNDTDGWSGQIATGTLTDDTSTDNSGWTFTSGNAANACAKFGTGKAGGSATTPELTFEDGVVYTLTFKAAAWNGSSESTSLALSATNATLTDNEDNAVSSVTTSKGEWTSYTVYVQVTDAEENATITFSTSSGNSRFFLDDVKVTKAGPAPTATVTINKYGYATYCSQYPMDFTSTTGYTAWRVSNIAADGTITFTKITEKIKGGQGVLLYNKNADGVNTTDVTINFANGMTEFTAEQNKLVGTTAPTYVSSPDVGANTIFGLSGNNFKKMSDKGGVIGANKAYLPVPNSVVDALSSSDARLTFVFEDGETTGIHSIENGKMTMENGAWYTLGGQKLNSKPSTKGLYIVNGKKVVVK